MTPRAQSTALIVLGFLITALVAELALSSLDGILPQHSRWPTVETAIKYDQIADLEDAEVVFLGSSITEAAVDPNQFFEASGVSAYNASLPLSSPFSNRLWLEEVVLRRLDPDLVVLGVPAWSAAASPEEDRILEGMRSALADEKAPKLPWNLALGRNAGVGSEWDTRTATQHLIDSGLWTARGHQTGYYGPSRSGPTLPPLPITSSTLTEEAADELGATIESLTAAHVDVVVMIEPGRHPRPQKPPDYEIFIESVLDHAEDWGVPVLDTFSRDWDRSFYSDPAHFNHEGTVSFTAFIVDQLSSRMAAAGLNPSPKSADVA